MFSLSKDMVYGNTAIGSHNVISRGSKQGDIVMFYQIRCCLYSGYKESVAEMSDEVFLF